MANAQSPAMHSDFPRWYGAVGLGEDEARWQARWAGLRAVVDETDRSDLEALLRLAFKTRQPGTAASVQKIRKAFKKADATFEMQGNDRELQVLAAVALAAIMDDGSALGAIAALSITTAALDGARSPNLPMALPVLADVALERIAEANRKRPSLNAPAVPDAPKIDFEKAATKAREHTGEAVAEAFTLAAASTHSAVSVMARRQASAMRALERFISVQDEELQMLWWLIGQRSEDLDRTFDQVPANTQPLVFAKELADSTVDLPGPASIKALLSRAGLKGRGKVSIATAINAADPSWLEGFMPQIEPSPVSTPIHYGIQRQTEIGDGDAWIAGWAAAVGVPATIAVAPLTLGLLFYRERLLLLFDE
jgi:hypothetical protein